MKHRHFTEYRDSDYRIARSMKELYGWDAPLYVEEEPTETGVVVGVGVIGLTFIAAALFVWLI
jgi:hypothetical protein